MPWLTPDLPLPSAYDCRRLRLPANEKLIAAVFGAITELTKTYNWEEFGTATPEDVTQLFQQMYLDFAQGGEYCMIGSIVAFATASTPLHTLACDGAIYNASDYPKLYEVIHPSLHFGANQFKTPDLTEKFLFGAGLSPSTSYPVGQVGGQFEVTLSVDEMPTHSHSNIPHSHSEVTAIPALINGGIEAPASAAIPSTGLTGSSSISIGDSGGNEPHNNMPPFVAYRYFIICE